MSEQTITPTTGCRNRHGGRGRRLILATALLGAGFGLGVAGGAVSQGYGPGGYGPMRGEWSEHEPMHGGPMLGDWDGWHHRRGPGFLGGPMFFGPGSVERIVDHIARAADASSEQRQKMNAIAQKAAEDLQPLREKHLAGRRQMREVLAAPTIDRAKLESLRAEQVKLVDELSKRITTAMADMADVLSPAQRAELAKRMDRFGGGR